MNTNKRRKFGWLVRLAVLVIVIIIGYRLFSKYGFKKTTEAQYQTESVQRGSLVATVTGSGQVSSANNTPIVTQVSGKITKLFVKNGDTVKVGQSIATLELDQSSYQKYIQQLSSYQNAKNSLASAQTNELTLRSSMITAQQNFLKNVVNKGKASDDAIYRQLNSEKKAAEEKYYLQQDVINQSNLSLTSAWLSLQNVSPTINAPISGTITGLSLEVGSVIPAQAVSSSSQNLSQNIANITTSNFPVVSVALTEIDIPKVKVGNKATLAFDAFPDKTFTGQVFSINTTGSVSSGVTTYPTTIILDIESPEIYANMSAAANIIIDSKDNVLYVPTSAVQTQNDETVVRTLTDGKLTYIPVVTGLASDTSTEIVSGLNEGDEVITSVISSTSGNSSTGTSIFNLRGGFGGTGRNAGH